MWLRLALKVCRVRVSGLFFHPPSGQPRKYGISRVGSTAVPIILITGGSGRIGSMLRKRLARPGRILRLLDITPPASPGLDEQVVVASVTVMASMVRDRFVPSY